MDILDVILAKSLTPQGQIDSYAAKAKKAVNDAKKIVDDIETITEQTNLNNENSQTALENAQAAATAYETIAEDIDARLNSIEKVEEVAVEDDNTSSYKGKKIKVKKNNILSYFNAFKNYTSTGSNEDGSMTQKAITNALSTLSTRIDNLPTGGSSGSGNVSGDFSDAESGSLVIVGENGNIAASDTTEEDLIKAQIILGIYQAKSAVGIEIDYENKTVNRIQEANGLSAGSDFNKYPMFGGRRRCVVNNDGEILAFYGDNNYTENGSLGQVMVYQPKFYYLKSPLKTLKSGSQEIIQKEIILISAVNQSGFELFPLFKDQNDYPLDYVLLPAYEGCAYSRANQTYNLNDTQNVNFNADMLSSISGVKPISGSSQELTIDNAEKLANNRGNGWHITNLEAETLNQILMSIEYGSLNLQNAFNKGIVNLIDSGYNNISCYTGSTSSLGSTSGMAAQSTNGTNTFSEEGKCAISYRGVENPYGNIWRFVGGVKVNGNSLFYKNQEMTSTITTSSSWISNFEYDPQLKWAMIPASCYNANSAVPVGDFVYVNTLLSGDKCCVIGGKCSSGEYAGPFHYAFDYEYTRHAHSYSARLMHIPTANSTVYFANINKWETQIGGE